MSQERTRKIAITGVMGAISIVLGMTRLGFIPWFSGASLTVMHIPAIIGAIIEGPFVGAIIGLIFGLFSMLQAAIAPLGQRMYGLPIHCWLYCLGCSLVPWLIMFGKLCPAGRYPP